MAYISQDDVNELLRVAPERTWRGIEAAAHRQLEGPQNVPENPLHDIVRAAQIATEREIPFPAATDALTDEINRIAVELVPHT